MSEEKIYVSNATNPLKKVMMCSPKYYTFNGINVITSEWMKKGDTEQNDIMVKTPTRITASRSSRSRPTPSTRS